MARNFDDFFRECYELTVRGLELDGTRSEDAHDVAQEAYVRAYARWWRVGHYKKPVAWVRRVAVNVVRDQHRQRTTRDNTLPRLAAEPTLVPSVADADSVEGLDEALELLPVPQRRAVDLYYGSGFSTEEAATRIGVSPGAFRFHLSRARRSLKPRMAEKLGRQELTPAGRQEVVR
jgi:RNA polymerase sigma-70 factor (ECF subfamily)